MDARDRDAEREARLVRHRHFFPEQYAVDVERLHHRAAADGGRTAADACGEVVASYGNEVRDGRRGGVAGYSERDDHRRVVVEVVRGVDSADSVEPACRVPDTQIDQSDVACDRAEAHTPRKLQLATEPCI